MQPNFGMVCFTLRFIVPILTNLLIICTNQFLTRRSVVKFTHFSNRGYSLFAVLGKEVIIGVLSVATLQHATAHNTSNDALKVSGDSTVTNSKCC